MLTLYYSPGACSLASHIALHEAGAKFNLNKAGSALGVGAGNAQSVEQI